MAKLKIHVRADNPGDYDAKGWPSLAEAELFRVKHFSTDGALHPSKIWARQITLNWSPYDRPLESDFSPKALQIIEGWSQNVNATRHPGTLQIRIRLDPQQEADFLFIAPYIRLNASQTGHKMVFKLPREEAEFPFIAPFVRLDSTKTRHEMVFKLSNEDGSRSTLAYVK